MYDRLLHLLLEGSLGQRRLRRLERSKKYMHSLIPKNDYDTRFETFINKRHNINKYKDRKLFSINYSGFGIDSINHRFANNQDLKLAAKMTYKEFVKHFARQHKLFYHGTRSKFKDFANQPTFVGSKIAAKDRVSSSRHRLIPLLVRHSRNVPGAITTDAYANNIAHKHRYPEYGGARERPEAEIIPHRNVVENPGSLSIMSSNPNKHLFPYHRIIRLFADKTRSLKTGQVVPKYRK